MVRAIFSFNAVAAPATVSGLSFIPVTLEGVMPLYSPEYGKAGE